MRDNLKYRSSEIKQQQLIEQEKLRAQRALVNRSLNPKRVSRPVRSPSPLGHEDFRQQLAIMTTRFVGLEKEVEGLKSELQEVSATGPFCGLFSKCPEVKNVLKEGPEKELQEQLIQHEGKFVDLTEKLQAIQADISSIMDALTENRIFINFL